MERSGGRWEALGALAGIAGPVLFQTGFLLRAAGGLAITEQPTRESLTQMLSAPAGPLVQAADFIMPLGSLCTVLFAARLWRRLRAYEGDGAWLSLAAFGGALLFTFSGYAAIAAERALSLGAGNGLTADGAMAVAMLNVSFFAEFGIGTILFLAATALVALRTGALPRPIALAAALLAGLEAVAWAVSPFGLAQVTTILFIVWMFTTSVALLRAGPALSDRRDAPGHGMLSETAPRSPG